MSNHDLEQVLQVPPPSSQRECDLSEINEEETTLKAQLPAFIARRNVHFAHDELSELDPYQTQSTAKESPRLNMQSSDR